jgi:hypothetical protein
MSVLQTKQNEIVLDGLYPDQFHQSPSAQIYATFVGKQLPSNKLFVVLGTDSGLLVDYLESIATAGQRFVCVDTQVVVDHIKRTRPHLWQENSTFKVELYTFEQFEYEILYSNYQDYVMRNAIILLRSLMVVQGGGEYEGLDEQLLEAFHRFRIDRVDNRDFKSSFDQQLNNVCDLMHPVSVAKGYLKGDVPAILLGGGPSLDAVIPWLKQHQHKLWIFAASRICKRLKKEGIVPDFIGVFDGQALMFDYAKEMYQFQEQSILITGEHPYEPLIRQWSGLKMYSRRRFPWVRGAEEHFISDGPTVTNALFGIGCYLGISELYLAGVDFCFTLDGVCHESGSIEAKNRQSDSHDTQAINYRGEAVGTNIQLYDARNLFEEQLVTLKARWPSFKAYNLNDSAAVVKGIEYQSLDQVMLGADKSKVIELFNEQLQFDAKSEKAFQIFLKKEVNSHSNWLVKIMKESKKGMHLSTTLFLKESKQASKIKEVLKLKTKLEQLVGADYQTLVNYGFQAFMETLKPVESEADMSQQEMQDALMGFFGGLNFAAKGFLEQLDVLKEEIDFRLLELDSKTDFTVLAMRWLQNNTPGRFFVWLKHYSSDSFDAVSVKYPELVSKLETEFNTRLMDDHRLKQHFSQRLDSTETFILRLQQTYDQKDLQGIQAILRQLSRVDLEAYRMVTSLATGMVFELKGELEDALIHYSTVDPNSQFGFIQQQIFPLAFSLKQYETGLEALKALSVMDARYLPKYAEALVALGENEQAIMAYQEYPLLFENTEALIHLIRLLVHKPDIEAANQVLQQAEKSTLIDQVILQKFIDSLNN